MAAINTLDIAEEKFGAGKVKEALTLANLVKNLSNCPNVDKYRAAYKVHLAHNDLAVLGLKDDTNYSTDKITEKYLKLVQLLHPNVNSSCAAPSAFQRVTRAWEILTDAPRSGMRLLPPSKRNKAR